MLLVQATDTENLTGWMDCAKGVGNTPLAVRLKSLSSKRKNSLFIVKLATACAMPKRSAAIDILAVVNPSSNTITHSKASLAIEERSPFIRKDDDDYSPACLSGSYALPTIQRCQ